MKIRMEKLEENMGPIYENDLMKTIANNNVSEDEVIEHTRKLYKQISRWKWLKKLFGRWEEPQTVIMVDEDTILVTQDELEQHIRDKTQIGINALEALKFNVYWGKEID